MKRLTNGFTTTAKSTLDVTHSMKFYRTPFKDLNDLLFFATF